MQPMPIRPERWKQRLRFEQEAWGQGRHRVAGLDEVGRGPLAGPVVAACVVLTAHAIENPPQALLDVDDSKKISPKKRRRIAEGLHRCGLEIGVGVVDEDTIDRINILQATKLAMRRAIEQLSLPPDYLLIDGMGLGEMAIPQGVVIKGDSLSVAIGAASVVAKVFRDRLMEDYDLEYPQYGFSRHKGYGTREHLDSLRRFGPSKVHRRSFAPVAGALR